MTAELAVGLPAVVLLLAVLLLTASAASAQLRCADAARTGARVAALGLGDAEVAVVVRRVLPAAEADVRRAGPWVEVAVSTELGGSWLTRGGLVVSASATAWREP